MKFHTQARSLITEGEIQCPVMCQLRLLFMHWVSNFITLPTGYESTYVPGYETFYLGANF
jgi:hypothetical protein